jgi:chromosomal replication initiation ATPase DnaA
MADQLKLEFASNPAFSESDFTVSASNLQAFSWIKKWPEWPGNGLLLHGPASSGKTHLAHIWRAKSGAKFFKAGDNISGILESEPSVIVEDIESLSAQENLLHLINHVKEKSGFLLLTAKASPGDLGFKLPDLNSRLMAMQSAPLELPDDALLKSVIAKLFSDRQLKISAEILEYLSQRIERSFKSADEIVEKIDRLSAAEKKNITIPLVRKVL